MFMYDMLNDKHKKSYVLLSPKSQERLMKPKQAVLDAQATAKEAKEASNLRAVYIDEAEDKLSGIHIPYKEKNDQADADAPAPVNSQPQPEGSIESGLRR